MGSDISRRDFLNGAALTVAASLTPFEQLQAQRGGPYPPALMGLRGSTDDAYGVMHALAIDRRGFDIDRLEAEESYDLVVIGAGLAGLTAAWAYRERMPSARVLILDNHDDFGGHARRCEFRVGKRLLLGYGGSESMVAPQVRFAGELGRILRSLRIYPERFERERVFHRTLYPRMGLSKSVFFDRETFGRDKLVTGDPLLLGFDEYAPDNPGARTVASFLADCPLSAEARQGLTELFAGTRDYLDGTTPEEKVVKLAKLSYRAFLTEVCRLPADAANFFQGRSSDNFGFGIDCISAIDAMGEGFPGAKALRIEDKASGHAEDRTAYVHHFPDGNASLARALVRSLINGSAPGRTMEDLVSTVFDYGRLDRLGAPVRLRLQSTAVKVRNSADGSGVDIGYVKGGNLLRVRAKSAVVATYGSVMPYICPEMGQERAELMRANVKAPLVYTKVFVRNWHSFVELGTHKISAPTSFHTTVKLDYPVSLGGYKFPRRPNEPMGLHLVHVPVDGKGQDTRTQARKGREQLLRTSFADFERAIRSDLDRMIGPGGFDAGRDILGITVNRWSHGYSYAPNSLFDDVEAMSKRTVAGKAKIGNIAFANSDTAWDAYAHAAMEEAVRAVGELLGIAPPDVRPPWLVRFLKRFS
jgi:spermidine dehydrogenase